MRRLSFCYLSILAFCYPFLVTAQNFVIKGIEEEKDAVEAKVNIRYDKSHNPCALVLFSIPGITDATFENTDIVDTFYSNFEYNVYVSEGINEIRVKHPLARDLVIDFAKQGMPIESLKVYRVNLSLEGAAGSPIEQEVDIEVSPQDAVIAFEPLRSNGQEPIYYDKQNRGAEFKLPIGDYKYTATSNGYTKAEGRFSLTPQSKQQLSIDLEQSPVLPAKPAKKVKKVKEKTASENITSIYLEPKMLLSSGLIGAGASFGMDIQRINIEIGGYYSFSTSEWITWQRADYSEYGTYSYRPYIGTFKIGYNVYSSDYFDIVPQVGVSFLKTKATMHRGETNLVGDGANSLGVSGGCKVNWRFSKHFHLALTPQYTVRVKKSDSHELIEAASMRMRKWNNTFSVLVGISYRFK